MKKKKVLLIDDERLARVELKNLLADFPNIDIVGEASNADEGIALIRQQAIDLIFLDIQMPEKSGFDMLEELDEVPPVIFITAYDEYAIKAFEFNALDYILKPVLLNRLQEILDRVFASPSPQEDKAIDHSPYPEQLYLKDGDQSYFVALEDISLFSSFGNYVKIHFDGKAILVHRSLNQIEGRIPTDRFFRANRYTIINLRHIQQIRQGARAKIIVSLAHQQDIEFSERKSILFRDRWGV